MRVLLVEDDTATAQGIEMMLRSEGYVCDTTDMGEDGLEIGKLYAYDIIIMDLMLPDMDGYEVLRRLTAARVKTTIMNLSGLSCLANKIKGRGAGETARTPGRGRAGQDVKLSGVRGCCKHE